MYQNFFIFQIFLCNFWIFQKIIPFRLSKTYLVNLFSLAEPLVNLSKSVISKKMAERVTFWTSYFRILDFLFKWLLRISITGARMEEKTQRSGGSVPETYFAVGLRWFWKIVAGIRR